MLAPNYHATVQSHKSEYSCKKLQYILNVPFTKTVDIKSFILLSNRYFQIMFKNNVKYDGLS
jgi:hypothetical protein